ncbi:phenylalanine--tRNA ligase subunit alpha [Methanoregula sp. UBA64]|uniref:phenylalanine--tRNA ligase subunit alpha n=1 Tax=Methanoregula sp. UBA64 TaxID=1915554 RepID=UPI0025EC511C|nr:phenylalanine--tRNA ligase subunit alpha [Methanoregula sp. UBA64]
MAELTLNEKRLLAALAKTGTTTVGVPDVAAVMEATPEAVVQWAYLAMDNGQVTLERIVEKSYTYTEEGTAYRTAGLPETQLLAAIGEKGIQLAELQKHPAFKIGFGQLRKKGLVTVTGTEVTKTAGASTAGDEAALADPKHAGEKAKELLKRKLLSETETVRYTVALTPDGVKTAAAGLDLSEEIGTLTRDQILSGSWKSANLRKYDIHKLPRTAYPGKSHPYQRLIDEMRQILLEMGFTEMHGGIVQSAFWNFDALFQPQDHPAREMQDTFYLKEEAPLPSGWERLRDMHEHGGETSSTGWGGTWNPEKAKQCVLRTHTTSLSIQYLARHPEPPVKAFCVGRVYRREAIDPTHTPEFEQLEGIVMDKGVTFRHLLGFLKEFYQRMGFEDVRFRPGFFPYTEPSVEPEIWVDGLGWVEMGGAGVFRQEVTAPWGVTCPVLAWGLGVSRVAMFRLGLKDLRQLYQSDLEWIRANPVHAPAKVGRKA